MLRISGFKLFLLVHIALFCGIASLKAQPLQSLDSSTTPQASRASEQWTATKVEHIYGLPDIKPHQKGTLMLSADGLAFTGKSGSAAIPRSSITAVNAGNERVEMWGVPGRIMRMAIPDNGGLAVAAVAHHRVDLLTVEFNDARGGAHSASFFLAANQADQAIQAFALVPSTPQPTVASVCQNATAEPGALLLTMPDWSGAEVPAAYQGLLYEHLVDRFRKAKKLTRVYRAGESIPEGLCPQYTLHLSATGFKEGSSVKRAMLGPVGMFVGTTQMTFNVQLSDRTGGININEQVKSTLRGEGESTNVADQIAKSLKKKYEKAVKANEEKRGPASPLKL